MSNSPPKAGEPSMEEILASIRKIISDDPSKAQGEAAVAAAPSLSPAGPASTTSFGAIAAPAAAAASSSGLSATGGPSVALPAANTRPGPSFGRLSEALRTTFANTPPSPASDPGNFTTTRFGQSLPSAAVGEDRNPASSSSPPAFGAADARSRSIDNELDDILGEPFSGESATGTPKPSDTSASGQWAVWRTPAGGQPAGSADGDRAQGEGRSSLPTPPAGSLTPLASPPPSLGRSGGGFYPTSPSLGSGPAKYESQGPSSIDKEDRFSPQLPGGPGSTQSGFGSLVPQRDAAPAASEPQRGTLLGKSPRFDQTISGQNTTPATGTTFGGASAADKERAPGRPAPVVIAAMPSVAPSITQVEPGAGRSVATAGPTNALGDAGTGKPTPAAGVSVPLPPRATVFSRPFPSSGSNDTPSTNVSAPPVATPVTPPTERTRQGGLSFGVDRSPSPPVVASAAAPRAPALPMAAAQLAASSSALDVLAAGLAASNSGAAPTSGASFAAPAAPQPGAAPVAEMPVVAAAGAPRTLEDMITDMVKPMLQKWMADNMPRIIEKALRSEASQPGGGGKPPGT